MSNDLKENIKKEIEILKTLKAKYHCNMTVAKLKTMQGFEKLTDEIAKQIIEQLEEYARIVLSQLNRLQSKKYQNHE